MLPQGPPLSVVRVHTPRRRPWRLSSSGLSSSALPGRQRQGLQGPHPSQQSVCRSKAVLTSSVLQFQGHPHPLGTRTCVCVSCGCCNAVPQTLWLETTHVDWRRALEGRCLESVLRSQTAAVAGPCSLQALGETLSPVSRASSRPHDFSSAPPSGPGAWHLAVLILRQVSPAPLSGHFPGIWCPHPDGPM